MYFFANMGKCPVEGNVIVHDSHQCELTRGVVKSVLLPHSFLHIRSKSFDASGVQEFVEKAGLNISFVERQHIDKKALYVVEVVY